jgi:hypothetical protein
MAEQWYYTRDGQQMGPVSTAALRDLATSGSLRPADLVWTEGMSAWAPASATRGLFPSSAQVVTPATLPAVRATASKPPLEDRHPEHPRERDLVRPRRRPVAGMSTGAKVGIVLAVGGVLGVMFVMALVVVIALNVAESTSSRPGQTSWRPKNGIQPPPPNGFNPPRPNGFRPRGPVGPNSYSFELKGKNDKHVKQIFLKGGQPVTIQVNTTKWDGPDEPDVDLYVYDSNNQEVAKDDFEFKDCEATFVPARSGFYRVEVHLFEGTWARCTVNY